MKNKKIRTKGSTGRINWGWVLELGPRIPGTLPYFTNANEQGFFMSEIPNEPSVSSRLAIRMSK